MMPGRARALFVCWILCSSAAPLPAAELLAHLPSSPVENAAKRAEALTSLAQVLSQALPGLDIEPVIFRQLADAKAHLDSDSDVLLIVADAAWIARLADDFEPVHTFVLDGRSTYRQLLISREPDTHLADLKGKRLSAVIGADDLDDFISQSVFGGEIDAATWFAEIRGLADGPTVVTEVLYGDSDAGLVADFQPLLASHLGQDLHLTLRSDDLQLPIVALRRSGLDPAQRETLESSLSRLAETRPEIAQGLGIDRLVPLDAGAKQRLLAGPSPQRKRFQGAMPESPLPKPLEPPALDLLPLALELRLPEPPSQTAPQR